MPHTSNKGLCICVTLFGPRTDSVYSDLSPDTLIHHLNLLCLHWGNNLGPALQGDFAKPDLLHCFSNLTSEKGELIREQIRLLQ